MTTLGAAGTVANLWRFPVKSMLGEQLESVELTKQGILGDRAHALIDVESGKVVSAKSVRLFPNMFGCRAAYVEPPKAGLELPPVRISLPDGTSATSDSSDVDDVLSSFFGRRVSLAQAAPPDFTIDMYHPDIEGMGPKERQDTVVEQKLGAAFFATAGMESPVAPGAFFDLFPMTVLTTSTLKQLNTLQPQTRFDERRFRMNLIVETKENGFVENEWVNHELTIGDGVRLRVVVPDSRCVMTTLAQEELPQDRDVLRTLVKHNKIQVADVGQYPCAGVYATVRTPGILRLLDQVRVS
jgi:uncharacterized protein YcbX